MKRSLHSILRNFDNTRTTNEFIHFLSKAPIFSHFFNKDLVGEYEAKSGINLVVNSFSYLFDFIKKVIYAILLAVIFENVKGGFAFFFILLTIAGTIHRKINNFDIEDYNYVLLLKVDSFKYVKHNINFYLIKEFILLGIALLIVSVFNKINYLIILYLLIMYLSIHLIGEAIHIRKIEKNDYIIKRFNLVKFLLMIICLSITILCFVFSFYIPNKYIYIFGSLFIIGGIASYKYLIGFKDYNKIHKRNLNLDFINGYKVYLENSTVSGDSFDINIKSMNEHIDKSVSVSGKKSYDYLYSMMLKRYKKSLSKELYIITGIVTVLCILMILLPTFVPELNGVKYLDNLFNMIPMMFGVMYFISSVGKKVIKLCFFQMDRYLINYNFYRSESAIKENLGLRLKTIICRNLIPTIIISLSFLLTFIIYSDGIDYVKMFIVTLVPLILSIFYSMYHISTYYLFQPYSFSGEVVNKAYSMLDYFVYLAVYILFDADINFNVITTVIVTVLLFIISIVLYYLVKKRGVETFRVR